MCLRKLVLVENVHHGILFLKNYQYIYIHIYIYILCKCALMVVESYLFIYEKAEQMISLGA